MRTYLLSGGEPGRADRSGLSGEIEELAKRDAGAACWRHRWWPAMRHALSVLKIVAGNVPVDASSPCLCVFTVCAPPLSSGPRKLGFGQQRSSAGDFRHRRTRLTVRVGLSESTYDAPLRLSPSSVILSSDRAGCRRGRLREDCSRRRGCSVRIASVDHRRTYHTNDLR